MSMFKPDPAARTLVNPVTHDPDLQINSFDGVCLKTLERTRLYSMIWVKRGGGTVAYEFSEHSFQSPCILFFAPFQPFLFKNGTEISGISLQFASDFYCIERHRDEISCNGVLFNNVYDAPIIRLPRNQEAEFERIISEMTSELKEQQEADPQLLLAHLKIVLIKATRIKKSQMLLAEAMDSGETVKTRLRQLQQLIENNFREHKTPSEYAAMLYISTKALGRMAKHQFGKTLTQLIQERIVVEAKRELALTDKPVKEIAHELGYDDPFYFSRLFKKLSQVSPERFRVNYNHF